MVSVFARLHVREDSDNFFFVIEVTESSALWQFLMGKLFQSYLDSESWMIIFSGVDLGNAWAFLGWIITGNVEPDAAIVEVVHMARSWGWECKGPCMIKLTQYSSWRWWYLKSFAALTHHQNRNQRDPAQKCVPWNSWFRILVFRNFSTSLRQSFGHYGWGNPFLWT